ncbi:hypothetical protein ACIQCF_22105 [Streptomyces sp. NPDC088353]|uniref:hypothetical protein n=1 Tax=Streptomyces sp. NPDC088353 TaxID=3365855 RepID=UPI0037F1D39E
MAHTEMTVSDLRANAALHPIVHARLRYDPAAPVASSRPTGQGAETFGPLQK